MKNQGKYTWLVIAVNSFFAELTIIIADALIFKDELRWQSLTTSLFTLLQISAV